RTEWADFSFPRDTGLADVHFAVQCQLHGARLRKMALDHMLSVNNQDVSETDLQPGDTILAGQSAFVVAFDGNTSSASRDGASVTGAAVAGGVAIASAAEAAKEKEPTAVEIAE